MFDFEDILCYSDGDGDVGHIGHLAGAVVGLFLGNVLLGLRNLRSYKTWKKAIWWYSLLAFFMIFNGILLIYIFYYRNIDEDIVRTFRIIDNDGDGLITEDELGTIMSNLGRPMKHSEAIFAEADIDGDGDMTFEEFALLMDKYKE